MRTSHVVEFKKSTCELVKVARFDPYRLPNDPSQTPASASLSLKGLTPMGGPRFDFSSTDLESSSSSDYYGTTGSTLGSSYTSVTTAWPLGTLFETQAEVMISYSRSNGCLQTAHSTNHLHWHRNSEFGWGIDEFGPPTMAGDPCGSWSTYGHSNFVAGAFDPANCGYNQNFHTTYDIWVNVNMTNGAWGNYAVWDVYTGGCWMDTWETDGGT
jgi:hypothetical protein